MLRISGSPKVGKFKAKNIPTNYNYVYLATFNNTTTATSTDGITWTSHTAPITVNEVAASSTTFMTTGFVSSQLRLYTSPDGITWTQISHNIPVNANARIAYNGTYWAVLTKTNPARLFYSTNGTSWTEQTMPASTDGTNGKVVACGEYFMMVTLTASEMFWGKPGQTWTKETYLTDGFGASFFGTGWGGWFNNKLILLGSQARKISTNEGASSTWTLRQNTSNADGLFSFRDNNAFALAGGRAATNAALMCKSTDGITWTDVSTGWANTTTGIGNNYIFGIVWDDAKFVAVGANGNICTSVDGVTVTRRFTVPNAAGTIASLAMRKYL